MAAFYRAFRLADRRFFNRGELIDHLCAVTGQPAYMAALSVRIMLALGFALEDKGLKPVQAPNQRDLMESEVFAAIAAITQNK